MRTLIFQHTPEERLGTLGLWLKEREFPHHVHHLYRDGDLPRPEDFDWLVILGGPMNIDEEERHPWLKPEKAFLREWLKSGKPTLGICLGGQLMAQALGGEVSKNTVREIGFHTVSRTAAEHPAFKHWPASIPVFQWHEDKFSLPPDCASLASSVVCAHQAFAYDHKTVGLQFHPEASEDWIRGNFVDFTPGEGEPYVQSGEECLPLIAQFLPPMSRQFFQFLDDFVAGAKA